MAPHAYSTATRPAATGALAIVLAMSAAASSCSSASGPSAEPVVFNLISIRGIPLPAASDRMSFEDENGSTVTQEILIRSGTKTLLPDGTFRNEFDAVRTRNGVIVEHLPGVADIPQPAGMWGTWIWEGDILVNLRTGPPIPEGSAIAGGCCTFKYESDDNRRVIWGPESNEWIYVYELASGTP